MNVLLTGAFGNVGTSTLEELVKRGHQVRCFDLKTRANEKTAERFEGQVEVVWGDLRRSDDIAAAVCDQEIVVHRRRLIRLFRPLVRYWLLRKSPYFRRSRVKVV